MSSLEEAHHTIEKLKRELEESHHTIKKLKKEMNMSRGNSAWIDDPDCYYDDFDYDKVQFAEAMRRVVNELDKKIETEGNGFIKADSDPDEIFDKLDLGDYKERYPLVERSSYIFIIKRYIDRAKVRDFIETRYKMMKFFLENDYEQHATRHEVLQQKFEEHKSALDEIRSGLDIPIDMAFSNFLDVCFFLAKENKPKEQLLDEHLIKSLEKAEKDFRIFTPTNYDFTYLKNDPLAGACFTIDPIWSWVSKQPVNR